MAITKTGGPNSNFNPTHNPVVYYFSSTNVNEPGFRYIAQVLTPSNQVLFEKTLFKETGTGECVLHLNRELSNYCDNTLVANNVFAPTNASDFYLQYKIRMGEEYATKWLWQDFIFASPASTWWPNANDPQYNPNLIARTALSTTSSSNTPPYSPGDWIYIDQNDTNPVHPSITGFHKILDVANVGGTFGFYHTIILDLPWLGSGASNGGDTRYADNRVTRFLNELEVTAQTVFNGALSVEDFLDWDEDDYKMNTTQVGKWLTNIPNQYKVRRDSLVMLNSYKEFGALGNNGPQRWFIETSDGNIASINSFNMADIVRQWDVSPSRSSWGSTISGSTPIITTATTHYDVWAANTSDVVVSQKQRFIIDDSCLPKWENIEMIFADKLGSIIPFQFNLRNVEDRVLSSSKFRKYLGGKSESKGNSYSYELTDGGEVVFDSYIERDYILRTDWLNDEYAKFFIELIESPFKHIKINGKYNKCNILSDSFNYEVKKEKWYELKRYEIRVRLANNEKTNV